MCTRRSSSAPGTRLAHCEMVSMSECGGGGGGGGVPDRKNTLEDFFL